MTEKESLLRTIIKKGKCVSFDNCTECAYAILGGIADYCILAKNFYENDCISVGTADLDVERMHRTRYEEAVNKFVELYGKSELVEILL